MKKTILASLFALVLVSGVAAAAVPAPAPADNNGCDPSLTVLGAAPMTPANPDAVAFAGLEGVVEIQGACCTGKLRACQAICAACGGVFEFNCDPVTCQSNCICNICP